MKRCCKCGGKPVIKKGYDTLQIVCETCGYAGKKYYGDYYDEGFMFETYGESAIKEWNERNSRREKKMNIDKNKLKMGIWYEDKDGNYLKPQGYSTEPVKGAHTYHTCFPLELTEHIYISHSKEEKASCKHRRKWLKKDKGLVKGLKGRMCTVCGCTQTRKWWQPWGRKWDNGADTTPLMDGHVHIGGGNEKIILAMANSGDYTLSEAIVVYASSCERCSNVLAWKYTNGQEGYEEYSEEWKKANTVCDFCKDGS